MPIIVPPPSSDVTLMAIEQATAPRVGPYRLEQQSATTAATINLGFIDKLKSLAVRANLPDLYVLRRGFKADGTIVTPVIGSDRQRIVDTVDMTAGSFHVDRPWTLPPVAGELLEFHHLDPEQELRPSVLSGLRRCFFEDRAQVTLSGAATERDLTASAFWLTSPSQVRRIQFSTTGQTLMPADVPWWQPFEQSGHLWLAGWPDEYPNTLLVTALRPHSTWVNGADSTGGPTQDTDVLSVDLAYAVAAAHIEAWRIVQDRMKTAAEAGYRATQAEAANEFTRQARLNVRHRAQDVKLDASFGRVRRRGRAY